MRIVVFWSVCRFRVCSDYTWSLRIRRFHVAKNDSAYVEYKCEIDCFFSVNDEYRCIVRRWTCPDNCIRGLPSEIYGKPNYFRMRTFSIKTKCTSFICVYRKFQLYRKSYFIKNINIECTTANEIWIGTLPKENFIQSNNSFRKLSEWKIKSTSKMWFLMSYEKLCTHAWNNETIVHSLVHYEELFEDISSAKPRRKLSV